MKKRLLWALAGLFALASLAVVGVQAATTLRTDVAFAVTGQFVNDLDLGQDAEYSFKGGRAVNFTQGVGANQIDVIFADQRTLAPSATENLDFAGTSLQTAFGANITLVELKLLQVCASTANTNNVILGGDAASIPFLSAPTTTVTLKPGGCFQLVDPSAGGIAVTATTFDIIKVANSAAGTSVTYDIIVGGSSS
jgi:hypothetical protein